MRAPTVESQPRCVRRRRSGSVALFASGGGLFTAEKSPKRAGGCGPRTPMGLRGVHPRKRHFPGRYAPPGHPVPYPHPFPASRGPVESEGRYGYRTFHSGRTDCPGNVGRILHTAVFTRNLSVPAVGARIARPNACSIRVPPSNVPGNDFPVGADAYIGPNPPEAGLLGDDALTMQPSGRLIAAPTVPLWPCATRGDTSPSWLRHATSPQGEAWASAVGESALVAQASSFSRFLQTDRFFPLDKSPRLLYG